MFHVKHLFKKPKRGLALGGGGVRSLSQLGVLKYFEEKSIGFDCIAGTSMGAVVGALYSYCQSARAVEEKLRQAYEKKIFAKIEQERNAILGNMDFSGEESIRDRVTAYYRRLKFFKHIVTEVSIISSEKIHNLVIQLIPEVEIQDLPVEFCCTATDLVSGRKKTFTEGSLAEAIMATTSIPGVMPPVKINDSILSDGSSVSSTPVRELKEMGADFSVAIEVFPLLPKKESFERGIEIFERCSKITAQELNKRQLKDANVVISPDVKNIVWADFDKFDYAIAAGEAAARGAEKLIK